MEVSDKDEGGRIWMKFDERRTDMQVNNNQYLIIVVYPTEVIN